MLIWPACKRSPILRSSVMAIESEKAPAGTWSAPLTALRQRDFLLACEQGHMLISLR